MINLPSQKMVPTYERRTIEYWRKFLKREADFEIDYRVKLPLPVLECEPAWTDFWTMQHVKKEIATKNKSRVRSNVKQLEISIRAQEDAKALEYLGKFKKTVSEAADYIVENVSTIDEKIEEKKEKIRIEEHKKMETVVKFLLSTGVAKWIFDESPDIVLPPPLDIQLNFQVAVGAALGSYIGLGKFIKELNYYQLNKLHYKRRAFIDKRINDAVIDNTINFKETFPHAVKGLDLKFIDDMEEEPIEFRMIPPEKIAATH